VFPHRRMLLVSLTAVSVLAAGCGAGSEQATTGSTNSAAAVSTAQMVDSLGAYCDQACRQALTLTASPASVTCKAAYLNGETTDDYQAAMASKAAEFGPKWFPNMDLKVLSANGDPATEASQLDTVVAQGIKLVILLPITADALAPAVKRATAAGVKIVIVDRTVPADVTTTIKGDDYSIGEKMGTYILEQANGKPAKVALLSGTPGASPTIARREGFEAAIKDHSNITQIADVNGNYNQADAYPVVANLLQRFKPGEMDWIASMADEMSLGALKAAEAAGRLGTFRMIANNGSDGGLKAIAAGQYDATVVYPQAILEGLLAAGKVCAGETVPQQITLTSPLVTKADANKYIGTNYP
jgi:ribose transport system substrate-binding protein